MEWFDKELFMCIGELYIVVSDKPRSLSKTDRIIYGRGLFNVTLQVTLQETKYGISLPMIFIAQVEEPLHSAHL